ncbi:MAG: TIGR03960 family B12-binding radical SAM protein [Endomicrobia bacterium]|nr:TIGR03960 family B12-binding radical SAM protein [Endomicrobiia bacterium]MCL2507023.1 TIGR03960 family B12-binding radical SAM protein [Endomicrobiia bacterium]
MTTKSQIDEILNLVQKPARYINSELNSYPADMSADFSVCLCFPDIYEVGASNLGLEILYHLINEKKIARCERAFAPDNDMEKLLRERNISLFSLESNSDLKSFDIIGFTIQCELVSTNIVNMLDLSGIPIFSRERGEASNEAFPLIIGGGPALTNPEPFADFFDLFVLGDGEQALPEIIEICKKTKDLSKAERLKKLSKIEGVYVPSLYNVDYNFDGTIKYVVPVSEDVKPVVNKRILNLENAYFPEKKIVPFVETVHNRLNIEVARGCPGQCRFCQASKYYRPWRQRPIEKLLDLVQKGIGSTGYEEVAFSSLSCSDYRQLDKLLIETNNLYSSSNLNISLPSLRCNEHSLKVAQYINRSKRPTLTFAPEAGSDRLRNVIGKYLSEKQIIKTLLSANAMGWSVIKLYFMIGLPTETDEDIAAINTLVRLIKKEAKGLNFNITVSPFVPKAQTAFQWEPMADKETIKKKIDYLDSILPAAVKAHNYRASVLEAFIAKGDRRVSKAIYKAWQKGARFDQWSDKFGNDIWNEAISESGLSLDFYVYRIKKEDEVLPWEHLNFGVSREDLYDDYIKGLNEKALETSEIFDKSECLLPENYVEPKNEIPLPVMRLRLRFSRKGALRFVSHLEQIEVFRRAARRSGLPVAYTAGFSPQVKSSYGPPISVGHESTAEYMELYFAQKVDIDDVKNKISAVLPEGFKLISAKRVPLKFPAIDILSNVVEYSIKDIDVSQKEIDVFLSAPSIIVEKVKKGKVTLIDAKPVIKSFKSESGILKLFLRFGSGKTLKPEMILKKLLENKEIYARICHIERVNLYIETKNGEVHEP